MPWRSSFVGDHSSSSSSKSHQVGREVANSGVPHLDRPGHREDRDHLQPWIVGQLVLRTRSRGPSTAINTRSSGQLCSRALLTTVPRDGRPCVGIITPTEGWPPGTSLEGASHHLWMPGPALLWSARPVITEYLGRVVIEDGSGGVLVVWCTCHGRLRDLRSPGYRVAGA